MGNTEMRSWPVFRKKNKKTKQTTDLEECDISWVLEKKQNKTQHNKTVEVWGLYFIILVGDLKIYEDVSDPMPQLD